MKKIKFDIQLNAKDIWLFSMYHSNRGFLLVFNLLFTVVMYGYIISSWSVLSIARRVLLLILANMFLIIQPAMLYLKSLNQAKSKAIKNGLSLELNNKGIVISSNGESIDFAWESGFRSRILPGLIVIYADAIRGYLLPDRYTKGLKKEVISILKEKTRIIIF